MTGRARAIPKLTSTIGDKPTLTCPFIYFPILDLCLLSISLLVFFMSDAINKQIFFLDIPAHFLELTAAPGSMPQPQRFPES